MKQKYLPPASDSVDLSLIRLRMGPAILVIPGILGIPPGIFGIGGIPDMLGKPGGIPGPPDDGGSWPPAGDLTAETSADIDTGDTCENAGGGWFINAEDRLSFGMFDVF